MKIVEEIQTSHETEFPQERSYTEEAKTIDNEEVRNGYLTRKNHVKKRGESDQDRY